MSISPIIPLWIMSIICFLLIILEMKNKRKNITHYLIIILLFVINLRIMIPTNKSDTLSSNLDVLFVIDNTISMNALDYANNTTRLDAVKKDCNYIIDKLYGAKFSLITFNNSSRIVTPLTTDTDMTKEAIDMMSSINELYAKGSSLNTPIETITSLLENYQNNNEKREKILFFISDGEITDSSTLNSYKGVTKYIDNGAVMGYGTKKGGYMKSNSKYLKQDEYIMDYTNYKSSKALSKIDENNLKQIAKDIGISYINMSKQSMIDSKLKEIQTKTKTKFQINQKNSYKETYYYFIIPLFVLLFFELKRVRGEYL